jgi:hypothetical protein
VSYSELVKLSGPVIPFYMQIADIGAGWASSAEINGLLHSALLSLEDRFDATVWQVSHPSSQAKISS